MKRFFRSILGVTLLEIMLVLAIAAMVIVMSIRYYQSATASQQANTVMQQVQGIIAAADNFAQPTGTYSGITSANIGPLLPAQGLSLPWGASIALSGAGANTYTMTLTSTPPAVCRLISGKLASNRSLTITGACGTAAANVVVKYTANP
ncbi:MAG: hypothetical protein A3F12_01850 [Gammaproteobacteria bacterium RIFCSPHIGHO2_12_FULL_38_14]|nr:MAG: hypothetical protein A3F12_01850 [Gammaproteobacteria bacterium RIFCSPHIGHO2_12_FULL_38_14]